MLALIAPGQGSQSPGMLNSWIQDPASLSLLNKWSTDIDLDLVRLGTTADAEEIKDAFHNIASNNKMIITTEKDASRLMLLQEKLSAYELPIYIQSIGIDFLFGEGKAFNEEIVKFIHSIIPPIEPEIDVENEEEQNVYDV